MLGFWKGRRIIGLFELILLGTLITELWVVIRMASAVTSLEDSRDSLRENPNDTNTYDSLEKNIAVRFNDFFFGAVSGCYGIQLCLFFSPLRILDLIFYSVFLDAKYKWFWSWIEDHCADGLHADRCRSCGDFSATTCLADLQTCYTSEDEAGPTCPYEICRENTLTFIIRSFK